MILTTAQVRAFQRGIAIVNEVRPRLEHLEAIAAVYPPLQVQTTELRARAEQILAQCEAALAANQVSS